MEALESATACRLKQWDRERVHKLKEKEEEEDKKAWDKMYKIQVKVLDKNACLFGNLDENIVLGCSCRS